MSQQHSIQSDSAASPLRLMQRVENLASDMDTAISLYMHTIGSRQGILLESAAVDGTWGRYSVLASQFVLVLHCCKGQLHLETADPHLECLHEYRGLPFMEGVRAVMARLEICACGAEALPPITRALYGYLGYETAALFHAKLARTCPRMVDEAEACLVLPRRVLLFDHLYNRLSQATLDDCVPLPEAPELATPQPPQMEQLGELGEVTLHSPQAVYEAQVREVKELLRQGEAIQVVPSTCSSAPFSGDAFTLYRKIRQANPSPYMFYMHLPTLTLLGSSPEVMVRCTGGALRLAPIAGTRKRGANPEEDAELAAQLLEDAKERAEHVMLVDLGRNDLGRIAKHGSVQVEKLMDVERFSHVMHLTSRIGARLNDGLDAVDVLAATFPAGTVSGAPKLRAMEIIAQVEERPRGPYAGCIGWLGLDKDAVHLDTGITIRSLWLRQGRLHWQAGAGLVHDSDPHTEWMETYSKSAIMRSILQEFCTRNQGEPCHVSTDR